MKRILFVFVCIVAFVACNRTEDRFLITNYSVGLLRKSMLIKQLDSIFVNDSIVNTAFEGELRYASNERIMLFEKGGTQLLELTPGVNNNNEKVVESVLVLDPRFETEKGISLASTFKDIKDNYPDFDIEQTLSSVLIIVPDVNYFFTLDKSALKSTKFGLSSEITKDDISDDAKLSRITINWDM